MSHLRAWFAKLTIVGRLRLIGSAAVLGMLITGVVHQNALDTVESVVDQYTESSLNMEKLDILMVKMLAEKESAVNFLRLSDQEDKVRWQAFSQDNDKALQYLASVLPSQEMSQLLQSLVGKMKKFDTLFVSVINDRESIGFDENDGLVGQFRDKIHAVEAELKRLNQPRLMVSMLLMRRHEKDFMQRLNPVYVQQLNDEVSQFKRLLKKATLNQATQTSLLNLVQGYQKTFNQYQTQVTKITQTEQRLSSLYAKDMVPNLDKVHELLAAHIQGLHVKHVQILNTQSYVFWGALLLVILVVASLITWIGKTITTPLNKITEAMDVLERGEIREVHSPMKGAISELLDSLGKFQKQSVETYLLKQVVEENPQAIMLADKDSLIINYMNPAAQALFQNIEHALPCKASELVGKNIDIFHKKPSHQRNILADEKRFPMHASFEIAGQNIEFSAHALKNNQGDWISIMVSWNDVTEQAKLAQDFETNVGSMVEELITSAMDMKKSSEVLSQAAQASLQQAESVATGANEASQNTTSAANAAQELSSSIQEITQQVQSAVDISEQAVAEAESTNKTVGKLAEVSEEIGAVVNVITDIAEQTNLLGTQCQH
ncbi:MAG: hypothetical protein Q9N62_05800 [Ghiorsea sp.]|nr:hypothetical protein [Ghiorsea sp.]